MCFWKFHNVFLVDNITLLRNLNAFRYTYYLWILRESISHNKRNYCQVQIFFVWPKPPVASRMFSDPCARSGRIYCAHFKQRTRCWPLKSCRHCRFAGGLMVDEFISEHKGLCKYYKTLTISFEFRFVVARCRRGVSNNISNFAKVLHFPYSSFTKKTQRAVRAVQ